MDDSQSQLRTAIAMIEVHHRLILGLYGKLRAKGILPTPEILEVIDAALEAVEHQRADPDGPGTLTVDRMRTELDYLYKWFAAPLP